jgi:hypothetical protein
MEEIYKGIKINLREEENTWECDIDKTARNRIKSTLPEARKRIDNFLDKEKEFNRYDVIAKEDFWGSFRKGTIVTVTSETEEIGSKYLWISYNGKRSKEPASKFCLNTEHNRVLLEEINFKLNAVISIQKEIEELKNKLTI